MTRPLLCLIAAGAALLVAGCGAGAGDAADATISGKVTAGPTCPVETQDSPCPPRPVSGAIVQALQNDVVVDDDTTDAEGEFTLSVPAGQTVVRTSAPDGLPSQASQTVDVGSAGSATVELVLDTGIR